MKSGRRKVGRPNLIKMDVLLQDMKYLKIRSWSRLPKTGKDSEEL